ncbi:MAG: DUF366 family protein [Candidatus Saganbacteria bacterium]|nr:DUF366 family protein [Candidatus Saganbacteria bacterium]
MKCKFINKQIDYTGEQLRPHYIYENFDLEGDAIISFTGKCEVKQHMVDLADSKKKEFIRSSLMLHFLAEHFDNDLEKTILRKRLLISIIMEETHRMAGKLIFLRKDNGLYQKDRKLTVAVATASNVSTLIHAGVNISSKDTPVKTASLSEYGIDPKKLGERVIKKYIDEMRSIMASRAKVKGVR